MMSGANKRKATDSPEASLSNGHIDDPVLDQTGEVLHSASSSRSASPGPSSPKRIATLGSRRESRLQKLPLEVIEEHLSDQKRKCLGILAGGLPPLCSSLALPNAATKANGTADESRLASAKPMDGSECIGLHEEWHTLHKMLHATVTAQESNSCLLIGASGSGKSMLVESVMRSLRHKSDAIPEESDKELPFYHVSLTGSIQINDRAAMKEMAQQLILQGAFTEDDVGDELNAQFGGAEDDQDVDAAQRQSKSDGDAVFGGEDSGSENDDGDGVGDEDAAIHDELATAILSSLNNIIAHIIALLSNAGGSSGTSSSTSTRRKPLIITMDDFDLFTSRPRQALLYCLLDAVQAASYGAGLAVVGLTSRVDTTDLLEKRVKSRFSHRILHVRPPASYETFEQIIRAALLAGCGADQNVVRGPASSSLVEFRKSWTEEVATLMEDTQFRELIRGIYELSNDVRLVYTILYSPVSRLNSINPCLDVDHVVASASSQISEGMIDVLSDLTEPEMALLIAVKHLQTRDRSIFNFEMCFDELRRFAAREARDRSAVSATSTDVSVAGGFVGSATTAPFYADRKLALMSFLSLLNLEILVPDNQILSLTISNPVAKPSATPSSTSQTGRSNQNTIRKEFWKVRSIFPPNVIVQAVKSRARTHPINSSLIKWVSSHG
ncbi:hypothetical protein BCV70DRAFT_195760 [Testicularia cyperi]|uniref:Origin recognition complex subunit 4 n=1 Tax=Testicularia cyperi TaxID=1882483 RepID=A0A317XIB8_9BASI|nr:hypothetical protein BCV70DRAFT_195760 [Testicularia cyperi]